MLLLLLLLLLLMMMMLMTMTPSSRAGNMSTHDRRGASLLLGLEHPGTRISLTESKHSLDNEQPNLGLMSVGPKQFESWSKTVQISSLKIQFKSLLKTQLICLCAKRSSKSNDYVEIKSRFRCQLYVNQMVRVVPLLVG